MARIRQTPLSQRDVNGQIGGILGFAFIKEQHVAS
jgi:hypothetical protein